MLLPSILQTRKQMRLLTTLAHMATFTVYLRILAMNG